MHTGTSMKCADKEEEKMKKIVSLLMILSLMCLLVGCGNTNQVEENANDVVQNQVEENANDVVQNQVETNPNEEIETSPNPTTSTQKILVAFFSRAGENYNVGTVEVGNTEIMAGFIKDYLGDKADIFKIDPVVPYPTDYDECLQVATDEMNNNKRPEFKNANTLNLANYDTIILGYPIWWGNVPMMINTFLETYDFSGKTVYLFNTHEGSGNSGTYRAIKNKLTSANVNTDGLAIQGKTARQESARATVETWLKGLGL